MYVEAEKGRKTQKRGGECSWELYEVVGVSENMADDKFI